VTAVTWGDGSTDATGLTVSGSGGNYSVSGSHLYAEEGTYNVSITVTDDGGRTATITGSATVADAALTDLTPKTTYNATEGSSTGQQVLATFSDANPAAPQSDFSATVSWGGALLGTPTFSIQHVSVSSSASIWEVLGSATYAEEGTYTVSTTVKDVGGESISTSNTSFKVADASLAAHGAPNFTPSLGVPFSNQLLATFTDATPAGGIGDFTASISWGDGNTSTGSVQLVSHGNSSSSYQVFGGYTYTKPGSYSVVVTITDAGGATAIAASTATTAPVLSGVIVLDGSQAGALTLSGSAVLHVGGPVQVDSTSATALIESGNATTTASAINVVGGYQASGHATFSPTPTTHAAYEADPLMGLAAPSPSAYNLMLQGSVNLSGKNSLGIGPGIYTSISVSGQASLSLSPGIYVIAGGGLTVSGQATVTGRGVMIYNAGSNFVNNGAAGGTFGAISVTGQAVLDLTPMSSGAYAGIVLFQSGYASQSGVNSRALNLSGQADLPNGGLIYAPAAQVSVSGCAALGNTSVSTSFIADTLTLSGNAIAQFSASGVAAAYTPAQVRTAYGVNGIPLDGSGQTVAVVEAYDDPSILQAVDAFDNQFGLTASGSSLYDQYGPASSFVTVLNQAGLTTPRPAPDVTGEWETEEALDVEWAHAMAPGAQIVIVEANSQSLADLMAGVVTAANQPGVSVVSMSWGFPEGQSVFQADEALYDGDFTAPPGHTPVTFLASTGDYGAADLEYPAFSPNVLAVGGTSLVLNQDGSYNSETAWGGSSAAPGASQGGGGTSLYEPEPLFQQGVQSSGQRSTPDVAFVADPGTGVWIADAYNQPAGDPWQVVGGTSLSAPAWAGLIAVVNQGRAAAGESALSSSAGAQAQAALYGLPAADFNVVGGGYNTATGLGTPVASRLVPDLVAYQRAVAANINAADLPAATGSASAVAAVPVANAFRVTNLEIVGLPDLGPVSRAVRSAAADGWEARPRTPPAAPAPLGNAIGVVSPDGLAVPLAGVVAALLLPDGTPALGPVAGLDRVAANAFAARTDWSLLTAPPSGGRSAFLDQAPPLWDILRGGKGDDAPVLGQTLGDVELAEQYVAAAAESVGQGEDGPA
jgi:hypothetical protein